MDLYLIFILYLVLHFALYFALVHGLAISFSERRVFAYHALPFAFWLIFSGATFWSQGVASLALTSAIICTHGIYTIVFLNLWSLSEGSYFMAVLRHFVARQGSLQASDFSELEKIGDGKKASRLDALVQLGVLRLVDNTYQLTGFGRRVSDVLAAIRWMGNHQHIG